MCRPLFDGTSAQARRQNSDPRSGRHTECACYLDCSPETCAGDVVVMSTDSDRDFDTVRLQRLVTQWRDGDAEARNELVRTTLTRMETLARRMLREFPAVRRWEETVDILQRSALRLMRSLEAVDFESTADFFRLAAAHIRRELIDLARHYRGIRVGGNVLHAPLVMDVSTDEGSTPSTEPRDSAPGIEELERWAAFHETVERLPSPERETFSLTFYHGWTQTQIAELVKVDERTIRRRWQAACLKLHEELGGELPLG